MIEPSSIHCCKAQNTFDLQPRSSPNHGDSEALHQLRTRMSEFYDVDSRKVSHAEIWAETKILAPIGWILKWLRIRLPSSMDEPPVDSILPFVTESLPEFIAVQFQPQLDALASLGFHSPVHQVIRDPGTQTTVYWATFLHESGIHYARVQLRHSDRSPNAKRKPYITFFTGFLDGTFFATSAGKQDLMMPPTVDLKFKTGAAGEKLWVTHEQRIAASGRSDFAGVSNRDELLWSLERHHILLRDFNLGRGVFCPRTAETQATADANQAWFASAQADGYEHADVLAQVIELQEKKLKWTSTLWILVISIIVFVAAGAKAWDWKITLWLIPVLLFHEAGHWVAMRICKYRNLRMFFIPFFGAAVTGQNWNVPGWKKALVSLAGPIPGILLGSALAIVAGFVKIAWIKTLALFLLGLNGFNLLPVLPLDGGQVLHAVLFCRHRWLDGAFRVVAVLGLVGIALLGSGMFMIPLIVIMVMALPITFKLAKVTDELRYADLPEPLPEEDKIPTETAKAIISSIKPELPKGTANKVLAQYTINVFETLNAKPPGVFATLALMATQGIGIAMALFFGLMLFAIGPGGFLNAFKDFEPQPMHQYRCGDIANWRGAQAGSDAKAKRSLIVATFAHQTNAVSEFAALTNKLPANARLMLFGHSLLLSLPEGDKEAHTKWLDELKDNSERAFEVDTNNSLSLNLQFLPPTNDATTNFVELLQSYFENSSDSRHLIAPWGPVATENHLHMRDDWKRIDEALYKVWEEPEMKSLSRKITAASQRNSYKELQQLNRQREKLTLELGDRLRARLRTNETEAVNLELLDLHGRLANANETNDVERAEINRQIGVHLGSVKSADGEDGENLDPLGASYGSVSQDGLLLELDWVTLNDPEIGLPAIIEWLCKHKCQSIKYSIQGGYGLDMFD